jgi:hypothetical protein
MYIHIYIYTYICVYICIYIHIYIYTFRLTCEEDHTWLKNLLKLKVSGDENNPGFGMEWETVVPTDRVVYGDFMTGIHKYVYICVHYFSYVCICIYLRMICIYKCTAICIYTNMKLNIPKNAYIYYIYIGDSESRIYEEIPDPDRLKSVIEDYLNDYNGTYMFIYLLIITYISIWAYVYIYVFINMNIYRHMNIFMSINHYR